VVRYKSNAHNKSFYKKSHKIIYYKINNSGNMIIYMIITNLFGLSYRVSVNNIENQEIKIMHFC